MTDIIIYRDNFIAPKRFRLTPGINPIGNRNTGLRPSTDPIIDQQEQKDLLEFKQFYYAIPEASRPTFAYHVLDSFCNYIPITPVFPVLFNYYIKRFLMGEELTNNLLACIFLHRCKYAFEGHWYYLTLPRIITKSDANPFVINLVIPNVEKAVLIAGNAIHEHDICHPFTGYFSQGTIYSHDINKNINFDFAGLKCFIKRVDGALLDRSKHSLVDVYSSQEIVEDLKKNYNAIVLDEEYNYRIPQSLQIMLESHAATYEARGTNAYLNQLIPNTRCSEERNENQFPFLDVQFTFTDLDKVVLDEIRTQTFETEIFHDAPVFSGASVHSGSASSLNNQTIHFGYSNVLIDEKYKDNVCLKLTDYDLAFYYPQKFPVVDLRCNLGLEISESIDFFKHIMDPKGLLSTLDFDYGFFHTHYNKGNGIYDIQGLRFELEYDSRKNLHGIVYSPELGKQFKANVVLLKEDTILDTFIAKGFFMIRNKRIKNVPWLVLRHFKISPLTDDFINEFIRCAIGPYKRGLSIAILWKTAYHIYNINISYEEFDTRVKSLFRHGKSMYRLNATNTHAFLDKVYHNNFEADPNYVQLLARRPGRMDNGGGGGVDYISKPDDWN